jgi:hypothetical protein
MSETDPSGPVDRYLDELFDRLTGTGGAGRRALAEAEDHLRTAAADAAVRGTPPTESEREAVANFGAANSFARRLRRAHRPDPLGVLLSSAWLLVGLGLAALSAAYLLTGADRAIETSLHGTPLHSSPPATPSLLRTGVVLAVVAAVVLVGQVLARRRVALPPSTRHLPTIVAVLGALTAIAGFFIFTVMDPMTVNERVDGGSGPGFYFSFVGAATGAAAFLAAAAWAIVRRRGRFGALS